MLRIGLLLLSAALDLALLAPLLTLSSLAPDQVRYVYYEPLPAGVAVMLDRQYGGYVTNLAVETDGNLGVAAGRTIAVPLQGAATVTVRTLAADLAPYIVLGWANGVRDSDGPTPFADAAVLTVQAGGLEFRPWDASRPWTEDREWLRTLHAHCNLPPHAEASIRAGAEETVVEMGSCSARLPAPAGWSQPPLLLVATGPHAALVSSPSGTWRQTSVVQWSLIGLALLRIALLGFAIGAAPTALASATLFAVGQISRPEAILCWGATLPVAVAAAAARLVARFIPQRPALAWGAGGVVLAAEAVCIVAAIALLGIGSFGKERIAHHGDDACAVVGYSTVRGDSLREGTAGIVERLDEACAPCRGRTSRFSREAQTLRWIRQTVCAPSFPAPAGGEVIFVGGGNDDLFYRPARLAQLLGDFATVVRVSLQPIAAADWQRVFDQASQRAVATLDDQAADIDAIAQCATRGGRRFRFVHDFLIWDLENGRTPARQQAFERRRTALHAEGGDFVDLLAELGRRAGVSWFNDFIHPSAAGQRMIADLLCARLASASSGQSARLPERIYPTFCATTAKPLDIPSTTGIFTKS